VVLRPLLEPLQLRDHPPFRGGVGLLERFEDRVQQDLAVGDDVQALFVGVHGHGVWVAQDPGFRFTAPGLLD